MFMLSRDRLNMDLDQETLNLMLRLLGVDQQEDLGNTLTPTAARALKRNRDKVEEVYDQFQKEAGSKLDNVEIESLTVSICRASVRRAYAVNYVQKSAAYVEITHQRRTADF